MVESFPFPGLERVTTRAASICEGKTAVVDALAYISCRWGERTYVRPSGPGDLLNGKESIILIIYVEVIGALRGAYCESVKVGRFKLCRKACMSASDG